MPSRVLVTGGAGFIGSHLAEALLDRGCRVSILDNMSSGRRENIAGILDDLEHFHHDDIRDRAACMRAAAGADAVFHLAAMTSVVKCMEEPHLANEVNLTGTLNMLEAARAGGAGKVVFASSSAVYGDGPVQPKTEAMVPEPVSPYALQKYASEIYCSLYRTLHGMETVSLRLFNVYGPRQDPDSPYAAVIPIFMRRVLAGDTPVVYGDGEQTRDFVHVSDVVRANLLALECPSLAGEAVNIASGTRTTINHLLEILAEVTGRSFESSHEAPRPGEIIHSAADISMAEGLLRFRPATSLTDGLKETCLSFR
ncbi:MAG: SDR family oxidoreductase [bacterium]|nr:MAG: SDR family oxidoreductase [bacterium]